jgi:L-seryl-tRNA(Ser) seleniumtransferase
MSAKDRGAAGKTFRPPSIEEIVSSPDYADWVAELSRPFVTALVKEAVEAVRARPDADHDALDRAIRTRLEGWGRQRLAPVINATGVLIHTNLGRAPLDSEFMRLVAERIENYGNLEFDLAAGDRGHRGLLARRLLAQLAGAEDALVVNNCAAAVLLMLALVRDQSVIISRGEQVQIGGGFRIPEIMAQSGARMVEVGTTNRTNLRDYENAVDADTAAILKVHRSNFQMSGFTEAVDTRSLRPLCDRHGLMLFEDLGSGATFDLSRYGLPRERTLAQAASDGADLVCASGDKLLGGPQVGLIVGRRDAVHKLARHPLFRALRPDKLTLAALEITLHAHLSDQVETALPLYRLLAAKPEELARRAEAVVSALGDQRFEVRASEAVTGGGTLPEATLPSVAVVFKPRSAEDALAALRRHDPPVIARIESGEIWVDFKTMFAHQDAAVTAALRALNDA